MARIIGEGPHETYYHTPDGNWTHLGANGKSWKTLEEAKQHYHQTHSSETDYGCLFLFGLFVIAIFFALV